MSAEEELSRIRTEIVACIEAGMGEIARLTTVTDEDDDTRMIKALAVAVGEMKEIGRIIYGGSQN